MFKYIQDIESGVVRRFDIKRKSDALVYEKCLEARKIQKKGDKLAFGMPRYIEVDEPVKEVKKSTKQTKNEEE